MRIYARLARKLSIVAFMAAICLVGRAAPTGLTGPAVAPVQAAALRPAPAASQEAAAGGALLKLAGDSLGAGTVTYVEGEALGWLFSAFGIDMTSDDSAQVLQELQQISQQISALQGQTTLGLQAVSCNVDTSTYSSLTGNNPAIPNIETISTKLGQMAHTTDRAQMLTYVNGEGGINGIFAQDPSMLQETYNLIFGTSGGDGALQLYSNLLTTCHTYFNQTDSNNYTQVWNGYSGLLTAACTIDVNYYRYQASVASTKAERTTYLVTAAADATACQGYAQAMGALTPDVLPENELVTCPRSSTASACAASGNGTDWYWASQVVPADCSGRLTIFSGQRTVCAIYLPSLNQGPWVVPPVSDMQSFLSSCANSSDPSSCMVGEGFGLNGEIFGGNPSVQFWAYDSSSGQPGQEPSWWEAANGNEPYPSGWCDAGQQMPVCGLVAMDASFGGVSFNFDPEAVLSGDVSVSCICSGGVILELIGSPSQCYFWCSSLWEIAASAITQGQSAAASVRANPPSVPEPPTATPQASQTPKPAAAASATETPRPAETATATPRASETPHPTETPTARPTETPHPPETATAKPSGTAPP